MKILLFLYPIEEFMQNIWSDRPELYELLNEVINIRYRQKGYRIVFATFKDKPIYGINLFPDDKIIEAEITFDEHITPVGKDEEDNEIYRYPSNENFQSLLGDFKEIVICGFHAQDCVMRVADYFYKLNESTIIDEELTEFLEALSRRFYFDKANYNLANRLTYDKAEDMLMYGRALITKFPYYVKRYSTPYFHTNSFTSDFTLEDCMNKLADNDKIKRKKSY